MTKKTILKILDVLDLNDTDSFRVSSGFNPYGMVLMSSPNSPKDVMYFVYSGNVTLKVLRNGTIEREVTIKSIIK